jgi:uncharacterized protein (TIGR02453 family)
MNPEGQASPPALLLFPRTSSPRVDPNSVAPDDHAMPKVSPLFPGFSKRMPAFFRQLVRNNDREWFAAHKETFEEYVRGPMIELVTRLNSDLRSFAVDHCVADPGKALYRIYRDTRFSKDKTPYKDHIAATFHRAQLPRNGAAGFYFSANHEAVHIAGGVYLSDPVDFAALRRAIADDPGSFVKVVTERKLVRLMGPIKGEKVRRLPKGYEAYGDSPVAEYLRHKQLYWSVDLPAAVALTPELHKEILARFRVMTPALTWMNNVLIAARATAADRARPIRPEPMF